MTLGTDEGPKFFFFFLLIVRNREAEHAGDRQRHYRIDHQTLLFRADTIGQVIVLIEKVRWRWDPKVLVINLLVETLAVFFPDYSVINYKPCPFLFLSLEITRLIFHVLWNRMKLY